jgi:hypothetical protein
MPNVWFYPRNSNFNHETYISEPSVNWGGCKEVDTLGHKGSRSVMLAALKLCIYLGFRRIFLLGCDFRMEHGEQNYAFEQSRAAAAVNGNNSTYRALFDRFKHLRPELEKAGIEVYNCNPDSALTVFDHVPFEEAVEMVADKCDADWDTEGWYTQDKTKPGKLEDRREVEMHKYVEVFSQRGDKYGHSDHGKHARKWIMENIDPKTLIDLGCGWNEFCVEMRKHGVEATGVDFACPGADLRMPIHKIPTSQRYDVVTSFDCLEHCLTDEIDDILIEMRRLSKRFVVSISYVQAVNKGMNGEPLHMTVQKEHWWLRRFRKLGATIERIPGTHYLHGTWPDSEYEKVVAEKAGE